MTISVIPRTEGSLTTIKLFDDVAWLYAFSRDGSDVSYGKPRETRKRRDKFTSRLVERLDTNADTSTCKTPPATRVSAR